MGASPRCIRTRFTKRDHLLSSQRHRVYNIDGLNYRAATRKIYTRMTKDKVRKIQHKSLQGIESVYEEKSQAKRKDPKIVLRATRPKLLTPFKLPTAPLTLPFDDPPVGTPTGPVSVELCPAAEVAELYALFAAFWLISVFNNTRSMIWMTPFLMRTSGWTI